MRRRQAKRFAERIEEMYQNYRKLEKLKQKEKIPQEPTPWNFNETEEVPHDR